MSTTRNKPWNGKITTLKPDYLTGVLERMATYGDRVQFRLAGTGQPPSYQVMNAAGKKMAFDSNNHLLHPDSDAFLGSNATGLYTMEQVKTAQAGGGVKTSAATRTVGSGSRGGTAAAKAIDTLAVEKYEYFKNNRHALPAEIGRHSEAITVLMKQGMSAEEAFGAIVRQHY